MYFVTLLTEPARTLTFPEIFSRVQAFFAFLSFLTLLESLPSPQGGEKGGGKGGTCWGVRGVMLSCLFALAAGGCKETGLCVVREHILYRELSPKP